MASLEVAAGAFASILTDVVNGTVSSGIRFVVTPFEGPTELAWVYPRGSTPADLSLIPISAGLVEGQEPQVTRLDDERGLLDRAGVTV